MDKGRVKDLATLLPWAGLFLFTPPVLLLFRPTTTIFGVPLLPVYLFAMWLILIAASRKLTEYLVDEPVAPPPSQRDKPPATPVNPADRA